MPKLTILISEETNNNLRDYVAKKYPREPYGKLSEITEEAIKEFLKNHPIK